MLAKDMFGIFSRLKSVRLYSLSAGNVNPVLKNIEYGLLGPLLTSALKIEKELKEGSKKNFDEVLFCTSGDNQAGGQLPVTFLRQILALCSYPELFKDATIPNDAKGKAKRILADCNGYSIGSYGYQAGINVIREDVAKYIKARDNLDANIEDIFITTGASEGMDYMMHMVSTENNGKKRGGIMLPSPTYALYLAYNSRYNNYNIPYYLDEENDWSLSEAELERSYKEGSNHSIPKLFVAINPGNPAGNVFTRKDIETIIDFAKKKNLTILADEVYQSNVYGESKFLSFKRVLHDLGPEYSNVEVISLMSASKGIFSECGLRGGYMELTNIEPSVKDLLLTNLSLRTCAPILGQAALDVVVNPPEKGDESYELFREETAAIFEDIESKASLVSEELNSIDGYSCNEVRGSIYAFPRVDIPEKFIKAAQEMNVVPDILYCQYLLENAGVCIVPGSYFLQKPGTHHIRVCLSPSKHILREILKRIRQFHGTFIQNFK